MRFPSGSARALPPAATQPPASHRRGAATSPVPLRHAGVAGGATWYGIRRALDAMFEVADEVADDINRLW